MDEDNAALLIELAGPTDWAGFRQACRVLLAEGVPPHGVRWRWGGAAAAPGAAGSPTGDAASAGATHRDLFSADGDSSLARRALAPEQLERLPHAAGGTPLALSRSQLRTLQAACLHQDAGRFELCHRWLHRVHGAPSLRLNVLDADWRRLEGMARAVDREIHQLQAFVRFRPARAPEGHDIHVAWFEPLHHTLLAAAPFFVRRFANQHWSILTPTLCIAWSGERLQTAAGARRADAPPPDAGEAFWLAYYRSTFNPARLKEQAMQREMPRSRWPNLPEAVLISSLVQQARDRTGRMLQTQPAALNDARQEPRD